MSVRLIAPFSPRFRGGGVITAIAEYPGQALYWELVSINPHSVGHEGAALGSLRWDHTKADKGGFSINLYLAPDQAPVIRVGMGYKVGEVKVGQRTDGYDRVKVRWADA